MRWRESVCAEDCDSTLFRVLAPFEGDEPAVGRTYLQCVKCSDMKRIKNKFDEEKEVS